MSHAFADALEGIGIRLVAGVPCSYFTGALLAIAERSTLRYVPAANEGAALAVAAGARVAGTPSAVIAQNSGFGNLINPLTSLLLPYRIPVLVVMSMRGWPAASAGEPQHVWMGKVVPRWLESLDVPYAFLEAGGRRLDDVFEEASAALHAGRTAFVLVGKNALANDAAGANGSARRAGISRDDLARTLLAEARDAYVISTTGYLSRALFHAGDRERNFYMQGSMGHAASMALGVALARPEERVVVLDGDGAVLMHLGALATIGGAAPRNLVHVVFDNGVYESTGAQPTGAVADFAATARACGYRHTARVDAQAALVRGLREALNADGPAMLVVAGAVGTPPGDRASESLDVATLAGRFAGAAAV